jgi:predicted RNase H-like HicB family nuclease
MMDIQIEPKEALTGFLEILNVGKFRLDFLVTYESDSFYIRCLDFGIMSCGETIEECMENILESISIYLEDLLEGENIYKPALTKYWQMFYELSEVTGVTSSYVISGLTCSRSERCGDCRRKKVKAESSPVNYASRFTGQAKVKGKKLE